VLLIDWDNLQICHSRDAPGTDLDLHALIALAQSYGTLVSARAYAEWNLLSERLAVYKAGIEPVFAPVMRPEGSPREGKSLADTVMVADGVDLLWTVTPDVFVLVTSDKDMIPLARIAKQRGAAVVVLGSDLTAIPLVEMSNVFITYRQLLRELDRVTELEAPSGRAPARERRLRESRRPSSEPYNGPAAIGPSVNRTMSRPVPPAVALRAPQPTYETQPSHRAPEPGPPADLERPLAVSAGPALAPPAPSAPPASPDRSELSAAGASDATPRRRRRRGGRGRRPGLDAAGDDDLMAGGHPSDAADVAGSNVDAEPTAAHSEPHPEPRHDVRPDDLDTAVLELLASRDRQVEAPVAEPEGLTVATPIRSVPAPSEVVSPARRPVTRSTSRRRATTTTFSDFGPSAGVSRSLTEPSPVEPSAAHDDETETVPLPGLADATPLDSSGNDTPVLGLVDAETSSAASADETPESLASSDETATGGASADDAAAAASTSHTGTIAAPAENGVAPSEPALEGAIASIVDAPGESETPADAAESSVAAAEAPVDAEPAAEPKRRPARRRTRKPTARAASGAASEPSAESGT
jgi:hypothetical protein